jgi:hypothetical protein
MACRPSAVTDADDSPLQRLAGWVEAAQEGFDDCAQLFERLALAERAEINELVQGLQRHLRTLSAK